MTPSSRLPPMDMAAAMTVVVLWGLNFVAAKWALAALPAFLVTAIRFAGVALLLAPFFRPKRQQLPALAALAAVLGVGHFGLIFLGLRGVDAGAGAVVVQLGVPFSVLLAWAIFGDRPDGIRIAGTMLAFGGVALLAGEPGRVELVSLATIVAAMFLWAVSNIMVKRMGEMSPLVMNGWVSLLAVPMVAALSAVFETGQLAAIQAAGWKPWLGVAFSTLFSSIVAYSLWYRLLARHPVSRIVPFTLLGPAIGFAAGAVILGEPVTLFKVIGGLLTVVGVAIIELVPGRKLPEAPL